MRPWIFPGSGNDLGDNVDRCSFDLDRQQSAPCGEESKNPPNLTVLGQVAQGREIYTMCIDLIKQSLIEGEAQHSQAGFSHAIRVVKTRWMIDAVKWPIVDRLIADSLLVLALDYQANLPALVHVACAIQPGIIANITQCEPAAPPFCHEPLSRGI